MNFDQNEALRFFSRILPQLLGIDFLAPVILFERRALPATAGWDGQAFVSHETRA
ncbi:hypothetical protein B0H12DRAFT_108345 [Mycena haematopus]|nr:hypothetical protein B0H12DRAFT_108345 [Mycena haematopus]